MKKILIIDDDPITVKILEKAVLSNGWEALCSSTAKEGLGMLKNSNPDLVLLDLKLPDLTGIEVIPMIKNFNDEIPIIMVSGSGETKDVVAAMQTGASDYVQKPVDVDSLVSKVGKLMEMRQVELTKRELVSKKNILVTGKSFRMNRLVREVSRIANSDAPVLVLGESGTGKSLFAELIHLHSKRSEKPFVTINCAAIPANLLESELFGHMKGSFTGAVADKQGKFEIANGGTIFLDEIGELSPDLQVKLLRVIQNSEFERVGGLKTLKVDVRIIAATNRNLEEAIQNHGFREDLYYRLNVLPVHIPPLRERKEDIPIIIEHFMELITRKTNKKFNKLPGNIVNLLAEYNWPGNVRELQNVIERAIILGIEPDLKETDFVLKRSLPTESTAKEKVMSVRDIEYNSLIRALEQSRGSITKTAKLLGISRDTVYRRLRKHNIKLD